MVIEEELESEEDLTISQRSPLNQPEQQQPAVKVEVSQSVTVTETVIIERAPYPLSFLCPITSELMKDPVIVIESRMVYERAAIESWFSKSSTDPMTNTELTSKAFIPVLAFKEAIEEWRVMHNYRDDA